MLSFKSIISLIISLSRNPTKGIIINAPNGEDVYNGVQKDYIGKVGYQIEISVAVF